MYKWAMFVLVIGGFLFGIAVLFNQSQQNASKKEQSAEKAPVAVAAVDAKAAEAVFKQSCSSCHGSNLEGGAGPKLQQVGSKLNVQQIQKQIQNGGGIMPAFKGKLKDDEIANLSGWLADHK